MSQSLKTPDSLVEVKPRSKDGRGMPDLCKILALSKWEEIIDYSGWCGVEGVGYTADFGVRGVVVMDCQEEKIIIQIHFTTGDWAGWTIPTSIDSTDWN